MLKPSTQSDPKAEAPVNYDQQNSGEEYQSMRRIVRTAVRWRTEDMQREVEAHEETSRPAELDELAEAIDAHCKLVRGRLQFERESAEYLAAQGTERRHAASCRHGDCWCKPGSDGT